MNPRNATYPCITLTTAKDTHTENYLDALLALERLFDVSQRFALIEIPLPEVDSTQRGAGAVSLLAKFRGLHHSMSQKTPAVPPVAEFENEFDDSISEKQMQQLHGIREHRTRARGLAAALPRSPKQATAINLNFVRGKRTEDFAPPPPLYNKNCHNSTVRMSILPPAAAVS